MNLNEKLKTDEIQHSIIYFHFLLNEEVFSLVNFIVFVVDLVPLDLHEPNATSQRCRSDCVLAFKQKNCSPGIIKSNRSASCGWTIFNNQNFSTNISTVLPLTSHATTKHEPLQPSWINSLDL